LKNGIVLLKSGAIAVVRNILHSQGLIFIVYQKFNRSRSLYEYPLPSSNVNIVIVSQICSHYVMAPYTDIARKCICMAMRTEQEEFAVIPLAHKE
jgi:hypothetical protein